MCCVFASKLSWYYSNNLSGPKKVTIFTLEIFYEPNLAWKSLNSNGKQNFVSWLIFLRKTVYIFRFRPATAQKFCMEASRRLPSCIKNHWKFIWRDGLVLNQTKPKSSAIDRNLCRRLFFLILQLGMIEF
jgi:hypothetical protein